MPGKTAAPHEIPYALETDEPPSMEAASKSQAEQVHKRLNEIAPKQITGVAKKQLLIANASGIVTAVTASGDVTNDESGVFTIGKEKVDASKVGDLGLKSFWGGDGFVGPTESFTMALKTYYLAPVKILQPCTITGTVAMSGAELTGNVEIGLFDTTGKRIAVTASTAFTEANQIQRIPFKATAAVTPGVFWLAIIGSAAKVVGSKCLWPARKQLAGSVELPESFSPPTETTTSVIPILSTY